MKIGVLALVSPNVTNMGQVEIIDEADVELLLSTVRNTETRSDELFTALYELGKIAGRRIIRKWIAVQKEIVTPMNQQCSGIVIERANVCVVSTKEDYEHFGAGVVDCLPGCLRGWLNLHGRRGRDALKSPIRSHQLPHSRNSVDTVIVAKPILATGCTALKLLEEAKNLYQPKQVIIAAVFHSENGIQEIFEAAGNVDIVVFGQADQLNGDGMLIPGVGNIDVRAQRQKVGVKERLVYGFARILGVKLAS